MSTTTRAGASSRRSLPTSQNEGEGGTDGLNIEESLPQLSFEEVDEVAGILLNAAMNEDSALQKELWTALTDDDRPNLRSTSYCKHCSAVVRHYRSRERVSKHLRNKCDPFRSIMEGRPVEQRPDWYTETIGDHIPAAKRKGAGEQGTANAAARKGRPPRNDVWSLLTKDPDPTKSKVSFCRHCSREVRHHKRVSKAQSHLRRCPQLRLRIQNLDGDSIPSWLQKSTATQKRQKAKMSEEDERKIRASVAQDLNTMDASGANTKYAQLTADSSETSFPPLSLPMLTDMELSFLTESIERWSDELRNGDQEDQVSTSDAKRNAEEAIDGTIHGSNANSRHC
jgi:hypothetical protein